MTPLDPSGFQQDHSGADSASLKRLGDFLLRGGFTPQDSATLKTSGELLARIFQAPELPLRPYRNVPLVGFWVERFQQWRQPDVVERLLADYDRQCREAKKLALMEARVRIILWKQLCRDRGAHLRFAIQQQLEKTINEAVKQDPGWAEECTQLLTQGKPVHEPLPEKRLSDRKGS